MLPDIRAVIAAIAAAIGLLMISFGLVATFRVAQDSRAERGWIDAGLKDVAEAVALDTAVRNAVELRSTAVACLAVSVAACSSPRASRKRSRTGRFNSRESATLTA